LGLNYQQNNWDVDLTGTGASGRSEEKFTAGGYWVWDLSVNHNFDKQTRLYIKVNNITNEAYEVWGSSSLGNFPMPGRNYLMGMQYQF
jgi:vitamin B12 transporter